MYNSLTGGCYDGLEKENVNSNQAAESTICYLIARIIREKYKAVSSGKLRHRLEPKEEVFLKTVNN